MRIGIFDNVAEIVANEHADDGDFVFGGAMTLAHCATLAEFLDAIPEHQTDAP